MWMYNYDNVYAIKIQPIVYTHTNYLKDMDIVLAHITDHKVTEYSTRAGNYICSVCTNTNCLKYGKALLECHKHHKQYIKDSFLLHEQHR